MNNRWRTTAGSGTINTITIKGPDGNPLVMTGSESLVCEVWIGGDHAPLFTVTPTASDAAVGQWDVAITPAQTTGMSQGLYDVLVKYADGSGDCYYGGLEILQAPGTGTPGKTYGTYNDLLKVAQWVKMVQTEDDEAGFLEQRIDARAWLDDILLKSYRGAASSPNYEMSIAAQTFAGGGARRTAFPSRWLREQLDADKLILRADVVRAVSYYAASLVGLNQVGFETKLAARGAWCLQMAEAIASNLVGELDLDGDGKAELVIPVMASNTLFT